MASGGLAELELLRTVRSWPTVAASPPTSADGPTSAAVEDALGRDDGLVVVTGPSLVMTTATTDRATRRMLGDHALVVVTSPHHVDLERVLGLARELAPVVVHVPDAPPSLLVGVTASVRAAVDDQVRLVVTTRPSFLESLFDHPAGAILAPATVRLDGPGDGGAGMRGRLATLSRTAQALARTVVDLDRLGLPVSTARAVAAIAHHGPAPRLNGSGRWRREFHERRAVASTVSAGLVQRRGDALVPTPALVDHAAGPEGWTPPTGLVNRLREVGTADEVATAGLVMLAQGDRDVAFALLEETEPDTVPPAAAAILQEIAARQREERAAIAARQEEEREALARQARRAAALAEHRAGYLPGAGPLLIAAGEDESDLEIQEALAWHALRVGDRVEARRRLELIMGAPGETAPALVYEFALMAVEDGRDAEAEPLLRRSIDNPDRLYAVRARLLLIRMLRRRGRRIEATVAAEEATHWLTENDPREWAAAVALELAALRDDGDDPDGAAEALRPAIGHYSAQQLAAAVQLALLEARRGRWAAADAALPDKMPTVHRESAHDVTPDELPSVPSVFHPSIVIIDRDPVFDVPDLEGLLVRGLLVLVRVAYELRDFVRAMVFVADVMSRMTPSPEDSLFFGDIALEAQNLRAAWTHFRHAATSSDAEIAARAGEMFQAVDVGLARQQAEDAARRDAIWIEPEPA